MLLKYIRIYLKYESSTVNHFYFKNAVFNQLIPIIMFSHYLQSKHNSRLRCFTPNIRSSRSINNII